MRAFLNFYLTVNLFAIIVSVLVSAMSGLKYFPLVLCTFGTAVGLLCYNLYFKHQLYFYYNLGYTKNKLALTTFIINVVSAFILYLLAIALV